MCKAREIFCRHHHCCGPVGWHILQPCPGSYLADCVADDFLDNTRWNWLAFTSGCKVPEVASRQRCTFRCCIDCFWTAMKDAIANADDSRDGGDAKDLFTRRITRAKEQGRDLLCEVGLWRRDEASEASNTAAGSEGEATPYEYTPQTRADTAFLASDHNPAASPAGSGSAEGQTCRNGAVADAACADGPGGLDEPLLRAATTSPSHLLRDELVLFPEFDPVFVNIGPTGDAVVSVAYYPPADFGLGLDVDLGGDLTLEHLDLELGSDAGDLSPGNFKPEPDAASAGLPQFPWEGDVLDQSDEFWDVLVGPDDGSMAYVFGKEAAGAAGTKRQWLADGAGDAWACSSGSSHKKQRF